MDVKAWAGAALKPTTEAVATAMRAIFIERAFSLIWFFILISFSFLSAAASAKATRCGWRLVYTYEVWFVVLSASPECVNRSVFDVKLCEKSAIY